jgi:capsular polysaccharide biosynthesis protein
MEELLKVVILEKQGFKGRYVLSDMPDSARQFLRLLGVGDSRIATEFDSAVSFQAVMLTSPITFYTNLETYKNVFLQLRERLLEASAHSTPPHSCDRIWLARGVRAHNERNIVNEEEVYALLRKYGFEIVDIGSLPPDQQIATAAKAKLIGGAHGAAMIHSMFLPVRSTVIECFSPDLVHPCVIPICRNLEHRYFQIVADNSEGYHHFLDVAIDCAHLDLLLRSL